MTARASHLAFPFIGASKADTRRQYSTMTKAQVMAQCAEPGAPVAKIVMAHGINANIVHRWRKLARGGDAKTVTKTGEFIALPLTMAPAPVPPNPPAPPQADLRIELRCGAITTSVT